MIADLIKGFIVLFLIFVPLERFFQRYPQKTFRYEWGTDAIYYVTGFFIGRLGSFLCAVLALILAGATANLQLQAAVASQPGWVQFIEAVVVADIGYYMAHRLLHTVPWLWKFHIIHHSIEEMDWLAAVRVHPVDQLLAKLFQMLPLYWLGFSAPTFAGFALFSAAIAFFIHSNVRVNAGPLKWAIATPEYHHWHHANQPGVRNKNLAAQLPMMDWLFGTLYMPAGQKPQRFGVPYPIPPGYLRQLVNPFHLLSTKSSSRRKSPVTTEHSRPAKQKPMYLRPLPLLAGLVFLGAGGSFAYAKLTNQSLAVMAYVFVAKFNTPMIALTDLQQGKIKPVVMIDVRPTEDHQIDSIKDTFSVPLTEIEAGPGVEKVKAIAQTAAQSNATTPTVVLYCQSGPRSIKAYQKLKNTGLNLVVLSGGIDAWRAAIPPAKDSAVLGPIQAQEQAAQAKKAV